MILGIWISHIRCCQALVMWRIIKVDIQYTDEGTGMHGSCDLHSMAVVNVIVLNMTLFFFCFSLMADANAYSWSHHVVSLYAINHTLFPIVENLFACRMCPRLLKSSLRNALRPFWKFSDVLLKIWRRHSNETSLGTTWDFHRCKFSHSIQLNIYPRHTKNVILAVVWSQIDVCRSNL